MKTRNLNILFVLVLLIVISLPVHGHFLLNLNVRIFHVDHTQDGLKVYLRLPMPYLVADKLGLPDEEGLPEPSPFTQNTMEEGQLVHYVDFEQIKSQPLGLGTFAANGFQMQSQGQAIGSVVESVRVYKLGEQPDFATLQEAKESFTAEQKEYKNNTIYVGDAVVDIIVNYPSKEPVYSYSLSSTLNPDLPNQDKTANLILDYSPGDVKIFRERGLMTQPIIITRSASDAFITFIKEGIRHILEGLDHVLFVICLVLGATQLSNLLWRVTGFTVGHSITLSLGFFGFVPSGHWFVPTIETGIALSIVYAALITVSPKYNLGKSDIGIVTVTTIIGLLHGLGFSFVLHEILQVSSPNIWQSLLAFNLGVEVGQILIVLVTWVIFLLLHSFSVPLWRGIRTAIAMGCMVIASVWVIERTLLVIGSV